MKQMSRSLPVMIFVLLVMSFGLAQAKTVPIAQTGFTLTIPADYNISIPDNAPNILLQTNSPGKEATVQVIKAISGMAEDVLAADYEQKMVQILPNLQLVGQDQLDIAGHKTLIKQYQASEDEVHLRVLALFYSREGHAFVIHSLDQGGDFDILVNVLGSLIPPKIVASSGSASAQKTLPLTKPTTQQHAQDKIQAPATKPAQNTANIPATPTGYHWFTEETSELRWFAPKTWEVQQPGANPMLIPPVGDELENAGGIKVQNLDRNVAKYKDVGTAVKELMGFISSQRGTMLNRSDTSCNGLPCHIVEFRVTLGEDNHHMWFVYVKRPTLITIIQYDSYGTVFEIKRLSGLMRKHLEEGIGSLREM